MDFSAPPAAKHQEKMNPAIKHGLFFLTLILLILSILSIFLFGKKYTFKIQPASSENISLEYDESIIKCVEQRSDGDALFLQFQAVSAGESLLSVYDSDDPVLSEMLYAHPSGIISVGGFFGQIRGAAAFSVSIAILLTMLLLIQLARYRKSTKTSLCRYANAWLLGTAVFILFTLISQIFTLTASAAGNSVFSILTLCRKTLHSPQTFTTVLLPFAVVIAAAISISNLTLMRHEGIGFKNMLGFFLGIALCTGTIAMLFIYPLFDALGIDVHNESGIFLMIVYCLEDIISIIMAYLECILLGTAISAVRAAKHIPAFDKDYILILGCQITKDGGLTKLLQSRTDRAVEFAEMQRQKTGKEIIFVPSGGKGSDEVIAEAEAIRNYLLAKGIPENRILPENQSENTDQNIRFSYSLIREQNPNAHIAFSTTNYHVFRAGCIADEAGIPMEGIGAKTKRYFWINAFIREFIAALHYEKKHHIKTLLIILCCIIPAEIIVFLSRLI